MMAKKVYLQEEVEHLMLNILLDQGPGAVHREVGPSHMPQGVPGFSHLTPLVVSFNVTMCSLSAVDSCRLSSDNQTKVNPCVGEHGSGCCYFLVLICPPNH